MQLDRCNSYFGCQQNSVPPPQLEQGRPLLTHAAAQNAFKLLQAKMQQNWAKNNSDLMCAMDKKVEWWTTVCFLLCWYISGIEPGIICTQFRFQSSRPDGHDIFYENYFYSMSIPWLQVSATLQDPALQPESHFECTYPSSRFVHLPGRKTLNKWSKIDVV